MRLATSRYLAELISLTLHYDTHHLPPVLLFHGHVLWPVPVDTDVSDFTAIAYQTKIILHLSTKPEMGWYARNMAKLQNNNCTIDFLSPTRHLITQQAKNWTRSYTKTMTLDGIPNGSITYTLQSHCPQLRLRTQ